MKFFRLAAVWRGGQQDQLLAGLLRDAADQVVTLLLSSGCANGTRAGMRFIHDDHLRALFDEDIAPCVRFDEVYADDLVGVIIVNAGVALNLTVEPRLRVGTDNDRFQIELVADLSLPLFAKMRQTDDGEAF